jgi:hypothetical protein
MQPLPSEQVLVKTEAHRLSLPHSPKKHQISSTLPTCLRLHIDQPVVGRGQPAVVVVVGRIFPVVEQVTVWVPRVVAVKGVVSH